VNLVAIESATAATAVAVASGDEVVERVADEPHRHAEVLLPTLVALLEATGLAIAALDAVVVDVGPGRFTGLRVGVATAKGLHVATGVGLVPVESTDVLAEAASEGASAREVVAVVDVLRGEVAWARYRTGPGGAELVGADEVRGPTLSSPEHLGAHLAAAGTRPVAVGDGAIRYRDVLAPVVAGVRDDLAVPPPAAAIRLARRRLGSGERPLGHAAVRPRYGREADAVANFAVRGEPS